MRLLFQRVEEASTMATKAGKSRDDSPRNPSIEDLRAAILAAEAEGTAAAGMILHLTFRDAALMKRSPAVGLHDISFNDGQMRFLGVPVVVGSVTVSSLDAHPDIAM